MAASGQENVCSLRNATQSGGVLRRCCEHNCCALPGCCGGAFALSEWQIVNASLLYKLCILTVSRIVGSRSVEPYPIAATCCQVRWAIRTIVHQGYSSGVMAALRLHGGLLLQLHTAHHSQYLVKNPSVVESASDKPELTRIGGPTGGDCNTWLLPCA